MKYQVFSPLTGLYTEAATPTNARIVREQLFQEFAQIQAPQLFRPRQTDMSFVDEQFVVHQFLTQRFGLPSCDTVEQYVAELHKIQPERLVVQYIYSVYNVDTNQQLSRVFTCVNPTPYLIKVVNGVVTELYEVNGKINDVMHVFVSRSLVDQTPIEYYDGNILGILSKYDAVTNAHLVDTHLDGINSIPSEYQAKVQALPFKDTINGWSAKTYGFIVEYQEPRTFIPAQLTSIDQQLIEQQQRVFRAQWESRFIFNQAITTPEGHETWTVAEGI